MCKQLEISRAAYYKWLHREIPEYELKNIELAELIKEYDERFNHILGYRRMTSWINHFNHTNYSKKRVHRIMQKLDIHAVIRKKKHIDLLHLMKRLKINLEEIFMQMHLIRNGQQM